MAHIDTVGTTSQGSPAAVHANASASSFPAGLADRLFKAAFEIQRNPRSAEYKAGARAVLDYRISGIRISSPHPAGGAQFDAFHAGVTEGHAIWRAYTEAPEHWQANLEPQHADREMTEACASFLPALEAAAHKLGELRAHYDGTQGMSIDRVLVTVRTALTLAREGAR